MQTCAGFRTVLRIFHWIASSESGGRRRSGLCRTEFCKGRFAAGTLRQPILRGTTVGVLSGVHHQPGDPEMA